MGIFDFMQEEIAIDLGTANTLIIHNDKVVVDEPQLLQKIFELVKLLLLAREHNKCMEKLIKKLKP